MHIGTQHSGSLEEEPAASGPIFTVAESGTQGPKLSGAPEKACQ